MSIPSRSRPPVTPKNNSIDRLGMSHLSINSSTPFRASSSSMLVASHIKSTIDPLVRKDMEQFTKHISVDNWVNAICGRDKAVIDVWERYFREIDLFNDSEVSKHVGAFCAAAREPERYEPFSALATIILKHARDGKLKGITGPPAVSDIGIFVHHAKKIPGSDQHGKQASSRMPDVIMARKEEFERVNSDKLRLTWPVVITCIELKFGYSLVTQLGLEQKRRKDDITLPTPDNLTPQVSTTSTQPADVIDLPASPEELEASEVGSTGSKRSRSSVETSNCPRPSKKSRSSTSNTHSSSAHPRLTSFKSGEKDQIGGYALEMLSSTNGTRSHAITLGLRADLVSLWYFDASGIVRTCSKESKEKLSLINNFERVAALIVALAYCEPEQFGAYPTTIAKPPSTAPFPTSFPTASLASFTVRMSPDDDSKPRDITLDRPLHMQYAIVSRQSFVYTGRFPDATPDEVAVKFSQQYKDRTSEVKLIEEARKCGIEHIPDIYAWKDFPKLSERGPRQFLDVAIDDRVFRTIVMPLYEPLTERLKKNPDSIITMVEQLIDCVHCLRYKAHVLHRDISVGNIMHTLKDGKDWFVLIDFDLGVFVDKNGRSTGQSARHRTGTLPFMSHELIEDLASTSSCRPSSIGRTVNIQHCVRHDFESLFWVSLWCAIKIVSPEKKDPDFMDRARAHLLKWETGPYENIVTFKSGLLSEDKYFQWAIDVVSPCFEHLTSWLRAFREPFFQAKHAAARRERQQRYNSPLAQTPEEQLANWQAYETAYGEVTLDKLNKALEDPSQWSSPQSKKPEGKQASTADDSNGDDGSEAQGDSEES